MSCLSRNDRRRYLWDGDKPATERFCDATRRLFAAGLSPLTTLLSCSRVRSGATRRTGLAVLFMALQDKITGLSPFPDEDLGGLALPTAPTWAVDTSLASSHDAGVVPILAHRVVRHLLDRFARGPAHGAASEKLNSLGSWPANALSRAQHPASARTRRIRHAAGTEIVGRERFLLGSFVLTIK